MLAGPAEAVGAVLNGKWRLDRLVGEGGLAAVYEATGLQGQGKKAIKLLHRQFVSQRHIVERFYQEAKASFSLEHPHISVIEAFDYAEDGSPYIVMELLQGMNLEEYLQRYPPMAPELAAPILYAVLQALAAAHQRGIVHRDLKPPNLFLVPDGHGQHIVKVLDFGIAKVIDVAGGMGSKTRTGAVLGTPGYMSPEQVKDAKAVDARSDLWSAGVVFYEMLTHRHPFGDEDPLQRMVAVLKSPPTPISQVAPHLARWQAFFDKALARDPAERFQSAEEMGEALRALAQGGPARLVPEGMQTVAIPLLPDMRVDPTSPPGPTPVPHSPPHQYPVTPQGSYTGGDSPAPPGGHATGGPTGSYPPAPPAGSRTAGNTFISGERPSGTPTYVSDYPQVHIEHAPAERPASLVWWAVMLIAMGCFAAGVLLGYWAGVS